MEGSPMNSIAQKAGSKKMFGKKGHKAEMGKHVGEKYRHGQDGHKKA